VERGPIFVGGMGRTGKTLMRFLLSSHPDIVFSRRTNMWTYFYGRYGDLGRGDNFQRCLAAMQANKHVALLKPDPDRIRREFRLGVPTYARLFALLHEHYALQQGKARWGDQTEFIESRVDDVLAAYPDARMIQMIRDPRDCYAAFVARRPHGGSSNVGRVTAMWRYSVALAQRNQARYPERYQVVRYETLVTQPAATMQAVCAFLHETYVPTMPTLESVPRYDGFYASTGQSPISADYIGQFRQELTPRDIAFVQAMTGPLPAAYDYVRVPVELTRRDKLALYCTYGPVRLVRMLTWQPLRVLRRTLPTPSNWPAVTVGRRREHAEVPRQIEKI
jgi:hypothetical protein